VKKDSGKSEFEWEKRIDAIRFGLEINIARCVEDLPLPTAGQGFDLPKWKKTVPHRATAWAYLTREDGGDVVILNGQKWHGVKAKVAS
jgi:hypothetical protein